MSPRLWFIGPPGTVSPAALRVGAASSRLARITRFQDFFIARLPVLPPSPGRIHAILPVFPGLGKSVINWLVRMRRQGFARAWALNILTSTFRVAVRPAVIGGPVH